MLSKKDYVLEEYHFAALVEAYCRTGDTLNAVMVLPIMRRSDALPNAGTVKPIVKAISVDVETIDRAFFDLQDMNTDGKPVDRAALNAIIEACAICKDLSRAMATFNDFESFNNEADLDTYNGLLLACLSTKHATIARELFHKMQESNIQPNAETYHLIVSTILTQSDYDLAFDLLEEMKERGLKPAAETYRNIIRSCVNQNDGRATVALEEMKHTGYDISECQKIMNESIRSQRLGRGLVDEAFKGKQSEQLDEPSTRDGNEAVHSLFKVLAESRK